MKSEPKTTSSPLRTGTLARAVGGSACVLGSFALVLSAWSCGGHQGQTGSTESSVEAVAPPVSGEITPAATSVREPSDGPKPVASGDPDSEPPDLAVSLDHTQIAPGQRVVIHAETTLDVVQVLLSDGINAPKPFLYDPASGTWSVSYRVPLRPRADRLALSVTAKNSAKRWCRKWVFLTVGTAQADSLPPPG